MYELTPLSYLTRLFVVYTGAWDAVVTCFFIDTAHNIVEYIEIISRILKEGGVSSLHFRNSEFVALCYCDINGLR